MKTRILFPSLIVLFVWMSFAQGTSGCSNKLATPSSTSADTALAGDWVAEKLSADGTRLILRMSMNSQGGRQAGAVSLNESTGVYGSPFEGTYSFDTGNKLSFHFDTGTGTNDFKETYAIITGTSDTQLILGSDVYHKIITNTSSSSNPNYIKGQVIVRATAASPDVGAPALTLSAPASAPEGPTPDVIVTYKDGHVAHVHIEAPSPPEALTTASPTSLSALADQQALVHQALKEEITSRVEDLRKNPDVTSVSPNLMLRTQSINSPDDPLFANQWNLRLLNMKDAWAQMVDSNNTSLATRDVVVAVVDTGIVAHPDLPASRILTSDGYDFVDAKVWSNLDTSKHDCRSTKTSAAWIDQSLDSTASDSGGPDADPTDPGGDGSVFHGTHVAGVIAAGMDNAGIAGASGPVDKIKILPLRAMGYCGLGTLYDVSQAILYAAKILPNIGDCQVTSNQNTTTGVTDYTITGATENNCSLRNGNTYASRPRADIINLSLGLGMKASDYTGVLGDSIAKARAAGVLVIAAAGNDAKGPGTCGSGGGYSTDASCAFYPAADQAHVVAVGAVLPNLDFASDYSNYMTHAVQPHYLVAPGGSERDGILGTVRQDASMGNGYYSLHGTSQATPHVSAVAAMALSFSAQKMNANDVGTFITDILEKTASDLGKKGWDDSDRFGAGLINPVQAIVAAKKALTPPSPISGSSALHLSADLIVFGSTGSSALVLPTSSTGETLQLPTVHVTTPNNASWLSAEVDTTLNNPVIRVTVNRTGLQNGNYSGAVTVTSGSSTAELPVVMTVNGQASSGDDIDSLRDAIVRLVGDGSGRVNTVDVGEITVLLVDEISRQTIAYTKTDYSADYTFMMSDLPVGTYHVWAGVENNGSVCDAGSHYLCYDGGPVTITTSLKKDDLRISAP